MAVQHFQNIPRLAYLARVTAPAALVFLASIATMGSLADPTVFLPRPVKSSQDIAHSQDQQAVPTGAVSGKGFSGAFEGGIQHWKTIAYFGTHVPEVCWGDNAVNEFQKRQCGEFWSALQNGAVLCLLPFAAFALFVFIALGSLKRVYSGARSRTSSGKPIAAGVVTEPAQAPMDFFSWLYGMRPIGVQLSRGGQIKVYIDRDAVIPMPGQSMVVFEPIDGLGTKRHLAVVHMPHVAVVSGIRQS